MESAWKKEKEKKTQCITFSPLKGVIRCPLPRGRAS